MEFASDLEISHLSSVTHRFRIRPRCWYITSVHVVHSKRFFSNREEDRQIYLQNTTDFNITIIMWPVQNLLLVQLVLIAMYSTYCGSSSIYIGRHASGTRLEQQLTYKGCEDFDTRKCQKIINWYGKDFCSPEKSSWARSLLQLCPASCGVCECKDNLGKFCETLSHFCNSQGETGNFLQQQCPKTCNTCNQGLRRKNQPEMISL